MPSLEVVANVALRVPAIVLLDLLYRWDVENFIGEFSNPAYNTSFLQSHLLWNVYYLAHVVCAVLVVLPLRHLVNIYLYFLTALLLYVAHQAVRDYSHREMDVGYLGTVYKDRTSLTRSVRTLTGLVIVCTLCSLLTRTRQAWLFSAPVLPLLARLTGLPLHSLPLFNAISTAATLLVMCYMAVSGFRPLCRLFTKAYQELTQDMELYRLVALGMALWTQLAVPAIFLVFWLVLYLLQVYSALSSKPGILEQQGPIFILLNSVSECCGTPYCLLGLTFTVSYLALGMLNICKFYLMGYAAFQNGNAMHRGVTEGVTLMLLSLQTGLLDLQVLQRTFLLSIIFFIVVTSTLQSMIEIADPIVLALAATGNRSVWKHIRGLSLCLFLLLFPTFMAYKIAYIFHMDFWLLILVSSCLLTSLQVLGTLFIYGLFMVELFQDSRVERMDEIIYGVNAISRVLEFLVALCVVAYGTWESIFGEWSWMGVSVIIVHSYFNVWLRAQSGWRSFLLRREAAKKISHLPRATEEELRAHNDVCSICFQEMSLAVITTCGHFFHADCLKKWLYVQDTCPLCHQLVRTIGGDDKEDEESDSEEKGAGGQGEICPEGEDGIESQGEIGEEFQEEDYRGIFVGENHYVVEEATYQELEQESETVLYRMVEEVLLEEAEHILYRGLNELDREEEILYMEKQEDDKVLSWEEHDKEVSCNKEEVIYREEQKEGLHCTKEQKKNREMEGFIFMEDQLEASFGKAVQGLFRVEEEVHCREQQDSELPFNQEAKVLYKEDQEVVPFRKAAQVLFRETENVFYRKEQQEIPCRKEVQVLYRGVERLVEENPYRQELKKEAPCKEKKDVIVLRKTVQVLHRKEVHCMEDKKEDVSCRKKIFCNEEEAVPCRKPVQVIYKEEVEEEDLYSKEQEVVPCVEAVQILNREAEEMVLEDLCRLEQGVLPCRKTSTSPVQGGGRSGSGEPQYEGAGGSVL